MLPSDIKTIRRRMPDPLAFPYYADRESPWLLARRMGGPAKVARLRKGPLAKFLDRPAVRPVVAQCGGTLSPKDLLATASPAFASGARLSRAALAGQAAACALPWQDFELTLTAWGTSGDRCYNQLSRAGGNLVLQLGFPSDHAVLMGRYMGDLTRKDFEYDAHPIRQKGRPTLAWARLDIDLNDRVALIEEVQSDWLRWVREDTEALAATAPRSRDLRNARAYDAGLRARYGRIWPRAMLFAALHLLVETLRCREIWMHQPEPGAVLKGIRGCPPPRSLYSDLPKSFGFEPTMAMPRFLPARQTRAVARFRRADRPVFWRIAL